ARSQCAGDVHVAIEIPRVAAAALAPIHAVTAGGAAAPEHAIVARGIHAVAVAGRAGAEHPAANAGRRVVDAVHAVARAGRAGDRHVVAGRDETRRHDAGNRNIAVEVPRVGPAPHISIHADAAGGRTGAVHAAAGTGRASAVHAVGGAGGRAVHAKHADAGAGR